MTDTSDVHPAIRTNDALRALAEAVASGKGVSIPLHKEQGFIILTPDNSPVKYTKAQAKALLTACHAQAKGATRYADDLPTNPKSALKLTHGDKPLWAKALNASTSRYTEAGKAIRSARDQAKIQATGGWIHTPSGIIGPSKRKTASAAIRADHGPQWFNQPNAGDLRKEYRADCVMVMTRTMLQMISARTSVPIMRKVMKSPCTKSTDFDTGLRPPIKSVIAVTLMMMVHTKKKQRQKEHDIATALSLVLAYGWDIASAQKMTRQTHVARMSWISVPGLIVTKKPTRATFLIRSTNSHQKKIGLKSW